MNNTGNNVMNWVQFGQELITWFAQTGQSFGFWGNDGTQSSGGGYAPPLGYEHLYGGGSSTPLQSGFGGMNITTLLLIGAGLYLILKR